MDSNSPERKRSLFVYKKMVNTIILYADQTGFLNALTLAPSRSFHLNQVQQQQFGWYIKSGHHSSHLKPICKLTSAHTVYPVYTCRMGSICLYININTYKANFQCSENKSYPHITAKFQHNSIWTPHLVCTALIPSVNPTAPGNDIL